MAWLLEQPILIIVIGSATAAVLGFLWLQTGRRPVLAAMLAVIALTVTGLVVERAVTTDREQIEATLQRIARDVERNDLRAVLRHVHSTASSIRRAALSEFPRYEFDQVKIKQNLKVQVTARDAGGEATEAVAEFNVVVYGSGGGLVKHRPVPRYVIVTFRKEDNAWRVTDYAHADPRQGFTSGR